jgi:hypothetical protein
LDVETLSVTFFRNTVWQNTSHVVRRGKS